MISRLPPATHSSLMCSPWRLMWQLVCSKEQQTCMHGQKLPGSAEPDPERTVWICLQRSELVRPCEISLRWQQVPKCRCWANRIGAKLSIAPCTRKQGEQEECELVPACCQFCIPTGISTDCAPGSNRAHLNLLHTLRTTDGNDLLPTLLGYSLLPRC